MKLRVLVTGGAGFIGSHVIDRLLAGGHEVTVVDNLSSGRRELLHPAAAFHRCDIRSTRLTEVFAGARPEAVVHVAAQSAVPRSVADPLYDASVNVIGTLGVLTASQKAGVGRVVYTSSGGAAYGETDILPTPDEHPTRATSPYGVSKIAAERYLECWAGLTKTSTLSLRLANVYGPRQNPLGEAGAIAIFAHHLVRGETCVINGDGEQTRDYVYVEDVADAVARALAAPEAIGVLNIGTGLATSVSELYRRVAAVAGATIPPHHGPAKPGEQRRSVLDATRAKTVLGWTPLTPLDDGLKRTIEYFQAQEGSRRDRR